MKTAEEYAAEAARDVLSILGQRMTYITPDDAGPVAEALTPLFRQCQHGTCDGLVREIGSFFTIHAAPMAAAAVDAFKRETIGR